MINVKQIAKFVVGLGDKVSPTNIEEGIGKECHTSEYESIQHEDGVSSPVEQQAGQSSEDHNQPFTPSSTPVKMRSLEDVYARCHMSIVEPKNYKEADGDIAWEEAMIAELEMIEKNNTWEFVNRLADKPGVKWVFKTKLNLDYG